MSKEVEKPKDLGFEIVETKEERLQERKRYIGAMEDRQVAIAEMERARQTCLLKDRECEELRCDNLRLLKKVDDLTNLKAKEGEDAATPNPGLIFSIWAELVEYAGMDDRSADELSEKIVQILGRYIPARIEKISK